MQPPANTNGEALQPFLEHFPENDGPSQRIVCHGFPFHIGRAKSCDYVIYSWQASRQHAVIVAGSDGYYIRDTNSANGTFVNGRRVELALLHGGDIIHVANKEFRFDFMPHDSSALGIETRTSPATQQGEPLGVIYRREALQAMMSGQRVLVLFQPIVDLKAGDVMGYEALGRGAHDGLSPNPADLFALAEKCGLATQLSALFRAVAFKEATCLAGPARCFFNVHPDELKDPNFVASLANAAATFGGRRLVMEVHENVQSNTPAMRRLRDQLDDAGIGLAYDDFGAGQARLSELAEVPPEFLKLDMKLIRGIHQSAARQDLVRAMTNLCARLGVRVIAEGIETTEEASCCRQLGCDWAQGFLFGHPLPASKFFQPQAVDTKRVDLRPLLQTLQASRGG